MYTPIPTPTTASNPRANPRPNPKGKPLNRPKRKRLPWENMILSPTAAPTFLRSSTRRHLPDIQRKRAELVAPQSPRAIRSLEPVLAVNPRLRLPVLHADLAVPGGAEPLLELAGSAGLAGATDPLAQIAAQDRVGARAHAGVGASHPRRDVDDLAFVFVSTGEINAGVEFGFGLEGGVGVGW